MTYDQNDLTPIECRALATKNLKLVYKIAWKYEVNPWNSYDRDDLINIGVIGLMKAVSRFNGDYQTFGSFASKYIKGEISHWLRDGMSLIRTPRGHDHLHLSNLNKLNDFGESFDETLVDPRDSDREVTKELLNQIAAESKSLSEFIRVTVLLKAQGLTTPQIAKRMGRSANSVRRDLSRVKYLVARSPSTPTHLVPNSDR